MSMDMPMINQSLKKANSAYHEEATCPLCVPRQAYHGTAWGKYEELKDQTNFGWPLYYDAKSGDVLHMNRFCHGLMIGSTGTGKTEVYIKNSIRILSSLAPSARPSMLITDLKGDIAEQLIPFLEAQDYDVSVMNMRSPYRSAHYNILLPAYDRYQEALRLQKALDENTVERVFDGVEYASVEEARQEAYCRRLTALDFVERTLVEISYIIVTSNKPQDESWYSGARVLLQAVFWGMLHDSEDPEATGMTREKFTLATAIGISRQSQDEYRPLISWLEQVPACPCVENAISGVLRLQAKMTRDGYISTLQVALSKFDSSAVAAISSTQNSLDLRRIVSGERPFAVVLVTDDRQQATNSLAAAFLNNFLNEATEVADNSPTHALPRDLIIMADEFANMPALPNLDNRITTLRSRRVWMMMAIQSIQQLDKVYTKDVSNIVQDNCDMNLFLGCNNDETKERFAASMGKCLGVKTSYSLGNDGALSASKHSEDVPLIRKSDLDSMQLGELYVRTRIAQNIRSYITPYFEWVKGEPKADLRGNTFFAYDPAGYLYDVEKLMDEIEERKAEARRREHEEARRRAMEEARRRAAERRAAEETATAASRKNDAVSDADAASDKKTSDDANGDKPTGSAGGEGAPESLSERFRRLAEEARRKAALSKGEDKDDDKDPVSFLDDDDDEDEDDCDDGDEDMDLFDNIFKDDRISSLPCHKEDLFAAQRVQITARREGGWSIHALVVNTPLSAQKVEDKYRDGDNRWYDYSCNGTVFSAHCSFTMLTYVLARLYKMMSPPLHLKNGPLEAEYQRNALRVILKILNGRADMAREAVLAELRRLGGFLSDSEDWYLLSVVRLAEESLEEADDGTFEEWKKSALK